MSKRKLPPQPAPKSADKKTQKNLLASSADNSLFDRVASILEQARGNVVRAVNTNMVLAYWLIGREIVQEVQGGQERAEYGKQVVERLSSRLTERYERGFSTPVLWSFRQFYLTYADRAKILFPAGRELIQGRKLSPVGRESLLAAKRRPLDKEQALAVFENYRIRRGFATLMPVGEPVTNCNRLMRRE